MRLPLPALLLTLLLSGCEPPLSGVCADPVFRHHAGLEPVDASPVHAEERAINRSIPSYAGTHYSGAGDALVVVLTENAPDQDIERAHSWGRERAETLGWEGGVEVRTTARYTFTELEGFWIEGLGFIFTEYIQAHFISPSRNQVVTGVADDEAADRLRSMWESHGLPPDALHFDVGSGYSTFLPGCPR